MVRICRFCLRISTNLNLLMKDDPIVKKIRTFVPVEIDLDTLLPKEICESCSSKVEETYIFCSQIIENECRLHQYLNNGYESLNKFYQTIEQDSTIKSKNQGDNKENVCNLLLEVDENDCMSIDCEDNVSIKNENSNHELNCDDVDTGTEVINNHETDELSLTSFKTAKRQHNVQETKICKRKNYKAPRSMKKDSVENGKKERRKQKEKLFYPEGVPEEEKKWMCLTCFDTLESYEKLFQHYKNQHGKVNKSNESNGTDTKTESNFEYQLEILSDGKDKKYKCLDCYKIFEKYRCIVRHMHCHDNERPYICNKCGRTYKTATEILRHGRVHTGFKTLFCNYESCNYSTVYEGALKEHKKRHDTEYKYKCDKCNKGFQVRTWYEQHQNVHTGERPFICDICNSSFYMEKYLTSHRSTVHSQAASGRQQHICVLCGVSCDTRLSLHKHKKLHGVSSTSTLCDICGKHLNNHHFKSHQQIHLGLKPHVCRTCGKSFVKKFNLVLHERVHSGEKPHVCSDCGKAFTQKTTLVMHMRYHTGTRPHRCLKCSKAFFNRSQLSKHTKTCI